YKLTPAPHQRREKLCETSAPVFIRKLRKAAVGTGCDIRLRVSVSGHPKPSMTWLKDRAAVKAGGRFAVRETADGTCEMRISAAHRSDAGLYVCKLHSERGTKQVECRVEVKGE
uniref:Ig-like domain-containing protein n=1 Tax=Xiphophorus couchianus TaxID=32473 RepID=A0A3B5MUV9_9TELE